MDFGTEIWAQNPSHFRTENHNKPSETTPSVTVRLVSNVSRQAVIIPGPFVSQNVRNTPDRPPEMKSKQKSKSYHKHMSGFKIVSASEAGCRVLLFQDRAWIFKTDQWLCRKIHPLSWEEVRMILRLSITLSCLGMVGG